MRKRNSVDNQPVAYSSAPIDDQLRNRLDVARRRTVVDERRHHARAPRRARRISAGVLTSGASRSIAWHAHSISTASTCARELQRALRLQRGAHAHADVIFLVGRGRDRVDARRMHSVLISEVSAAAVTCAIIRPDCSPPCARQERRQAAQRRVDQPFRRAAR